MRKSTLKSLSLMACLSLGLPVNASDFSVDGVYYNVLSAENLTAEVAPGPLPAYSGNVRIPEQVTFEEKTYTVTAVGATAFQDCESLLMATLPSSITSIGESAFSGCSNMITLDIPTAVTTIGPSAFYGCRALEQVVLPDGVETVSKSMLASCSSL